MTLVTTGPSGPIWRRAMDEPEKVLQAFPSTGRWQEFKTKLQTNYVGLQELRRDLAEGAPAYDPSSTDQNDIIKKVHDDHRFLSGDDLSQITFNKKIEKEFLLFDEKDMFDRWYYSETTAQINAHLSQLLIAALSVLLILQNDLEQKKLVLQYQDWAKGLDAYWSQHLDQQIDEQTAMLESMDALLSTQRRLGRFTRSDVHALERWQWWTTRVFVVLLIVLVVLLVMYYSDRARGVMQSLRATVAE